MEIVKVIEELESQIEQSTRIPMTGRVMIDEELLLDYLDKLRMKIPEDIKQAQWITKERERVLSDAQAEAERIVSKAKAYVNQQASENEIVKVAEQHAQKIISQAQAEAEQISAQAKAFALDVLLKLESSLNKATEAVKEGQSQMGENRD